jgi:integrase
MAGRTHRRRGHVEERPNGSFRAVVYAGTDPLTRKPRYLKETAPTWDAAEAALARLLHQVDERRHPRSSVTVGQIIENWLEVTRHEDSTRERYEELIRIYIRPTLFDLQAAKVDAELLERLYARLLACREMCGGSRRPGHTCSPLAPNTVRKVHFILRAAFDRAVRWKYLGINEAAIAEPPAFESSEPDPPSADEAAKLLNEAWRDPTWGLLLWLTMVLGARRGEICGLQWTDLNLDLGLVSIEFSYSRTRRAAKRKKTKTRQKRRIALDEYTVALLRAYLDSRKAECAELEIRLPADAYVFSGSPDGLTPLTPRSVSQRYRRLAQRLGIRSTRLHALRHYSATELLMAGVNLRTVAGRLGHGSAATTLRFYVAWVDKADRSAADTIASIVPRPDAAKREQRNPYERVAAVLRNAILAGAIKAGDCLPTVVQIASDHHVSTGTAHRAVAMLASEGLIDVTRGRRAVVRSEERHVLPAPRGESLPAAPV